MNLTDPANSPHFTEWADLTDPARVHGSDESIRAACEADPSRLAALIEDPQVPLPQRLAAGAVLAAVGDPRVSSRGPATCFVPGGTVWMGLSPQEVVSVVDQWQHVGVIASWISKETPEHVVELPDFWIARYPVTVGEYREFLAASGREVRPSTWYLGAYPWEQSNHPVAGVLPEHADAYARWLSERTGHPWRLPSEVEWERAAKGDDGREFPWGDTFDADACNTRETGVHTTTPVGAFPAGRSPFGIHDMGGNVEEFVADDYAPYPGGALVEDHLAESIGTYRVARGGSFSRFGDLTRTRRRHGPFPGPLYPVGFRLATSERPS